MPRSFPLRRATVIASALLAGCSAIQIDVDVYKGPLAHEPEIQIQQFAALAIAARPLLASLRTDIETDYRAIWGPRRLEQEVPDPAQRESYLDDADVKLQSRLARFVNGALSSYDDLGDAAGAQVRRAHTRLNDAAGRLDVNAIDQQLGQRIATGSGASDKFAKAYVEFLCGSKGATCNEPLAPKPLDRGAPSMLYPPACQAQQGLVCAVEKRSNEGFAILKDVTQVRAHSKYLFNKIEPAFVDRMLDLGRSYETARGSMRNVFLAGLDLIDLYSKRDDQRAIRSAAQVVRLAVQPAFLACLLSSPPGQELAARPVGAALMQRWRALGSDFVSADNSRLAWAIHDQALSMPAQTAELLRTADRLTETSTPSALSNCTLIRDEYRGDIEPFVARRFGLARGARYNKEMREVISDIKRSLAELGANAAGFGHARLPDGLDTLTREYREQLDRLAGGAPDAQLQRSLVRLEESLLVFAERVLFVTNTLTQRVLEDELAGLEEGRVARLAARMATLQTLGNTLVLHANDLTRRRQHIGRQEAAGPAELAAARSAFMPGADVAYDAFMLSAQAELRKLTSVKASQDAAVKVVDTRLANFDAKSKAASDLKLGAAKALDVAKAEQQALESTLRTLAPALERRDVPEASAATPREREALKAQEEVDRKSLQGELATLSKEQPEGLEPLAFVDWLRGKIDAMRSDTASSTARLSRLNEAAAVLLQEREKLSLVVSKNKDPKVPRAALVAELKQLHGLSRASSREMQTKSDRAVAHAEAAQKDLDRLKAQGEAAGQQRQATADAIPAAERVRAELEAARTSVIAKAVEAQARDPAALQRLLRVHVSAAVQATPPPSPERKAALTETLKFLDTFTPPARFTLELPPGTKAATQPRDVLDQVIAALRQQRIEATAGGQHERAANLAKAIDQAYEARQSSTFLRPAADYLKSVYSATALADGPQSPYTNLLLDYLKRLGPDQLDDHSEFDRRTRDAKEQVEKLYWQNINRVTVSGGGQTNTVLAKDDVGNWYVKSYSADPEAVIRSAKSLALFRAGGKVDVNLLRRADLQRKADDQNLNTQERNRARDDLANVGPDVNLGLVRVQDRLRSNYDRDTAASVDGLRVAIVYLPDALKAAAADHADLKPVAAQVDTIVKAADDKHLRPLHVQMQAAHDTPASDSERLNRLHDALVEGLRGLRNFAREMVGAADGLKDRPGATAGTINAAATLARSESSKRIDAAATRQKAVLDTFQSGLELVGEARTAP